MPETKTKTKSAKAKPKAKEDTEKDILSKLMKKIDSIAKEVKALKKEDTEKEDSDPRDILLNKGEVVFRTLLKDNLSSEKLDTMNFNDLILAYELKAEMKEDVKEKEVGNKMEDKKDTISYADKMLGVVFK